MPTGFAYTGTLPSDYTEKTNGENINFLKYQLSL